LARLKSEDIIPHSQEEKEFNKQLVKKYNNKIEDLKQFSETRKEIANSLSNIANDLGSKSVNIHMVNYVIESEIKSILKKSNEKFANSYRSIMLGFIKELNEYDNTLNESKEQ